MEIIHDEIKAENGFVRLAIEDIMFSIFVIFVPFVKILFLMAFQGRVVVHIFLGRAVDVILNGLGCDGDE